MVKSQIYIYGAGNMGTQLLRFLKDIDCNVKGFIQSELGDEYEHEGIRIYSVDEFSQMIESGSYNKEQIRIAIAISDNYTNMLVMRTLIDIGVARKNIWKFNNFLIENRNISDVAAGKNSCNICGVENVKFLDFYATDQSFFIKHKMIGGGDRKNCNCPLCGSSDRFRFIYWVLENKTDILRGGKNKILHFAPEHPIYNILKSKTNIDYYPCDLLPEVGEVKVDVTDIQFIDNFFDFVIINHVMEHIMDETKALSEIYRVLKPGGVAIISIPICLDIDETFEDCSITSREQRLKFYGQEDHVRLYGMDYCKRFSKIGFKITEYTPEKEVDVDMISKYKFINNDVVMVCQKPYRMS